MRKIFYLIFVAISLGGCASLTAETGSPETPIVPVATITPVITEMTPSQISTVTLTRVDFQVENLNPSSRIVKLPELDLRPTTRILVFDPKTKQTLSISDESINSIPNIQSDADIFDHGIEISPDHRWFAYLEIKEGFNIWINSVDGSQHFVGLKNAIGSSFRWLNNDKVVVDHKMGLWFDCPSEIQIFDPFTKAVNNVPYISTAGSPYCFPIPYFNPDFSQALYLNSKTGWEVFDYRTQSSYSVLPSLDTSPSSDKYFFHWGNDGLSFAIPDADKITFAFDLPEAEFTSKPTLNTISLPNGTVNENALFTFWIPEEQIVGLDLVGTGDKTVLGCDVPQTFVMINLATRKLNNYCLNRSLFSDQIGTPWFMYTSADYRFVGWTIRELLSNEKPLGAVILDTKTGKLSYLEGYELLGFGELGQ